MATYLKGLSAVLVLAGLLASGLAWHAATTDEAYYKALRGLEKYPGNVLYKTELKMAEPRHLLLAATAAGAAPTALVIASGLLGLASALKKLDGLLDAARNKPHL
ncbi:MAG: hypothetical protein D6815_08730 [Candidatus Dadabacteria bacterium]|nr:MAG: hypothetical protein D6815_08730 [Candidatus Dadabacteria bacterium]